jgi:hypothetical protein
MRTTMTLSAAPNTIVAHVIDRDTPRESLVTLQTLRRELIDRQQLVLQVGPASDRLPRQPDAIHLHAPLGLAALRAEALRRTLRRAGAPDPADVILHAWSRGAARWVAPALAFCRALIIDVPPNSDPATTLVWCPGGDLHRLPTYVCRSRRQQQRVIHLGLPVANSRLIRDGIADVAPDPQRRDATRQRLQLEPHHRAILPLPSAAGDDGVYLGTWSTLLLEKVHPNVRLILPNDARAARLVHSTRHEHAVRVDPARAEPSDLLPAADIATFLPAHDAPVRGMLAAMLAGVPLVATAVPLVTEWLRHAESAWICRTRRPRELAACLLQALEDQATSDQHARRARQIALAASSLDAMIRAYGTLYETSAAAAPAPKKGTPPTAGPSAACGVTGATYQDAGGPAG